MEPLDFKEGDVEYTVDWLDDYLSKAKPGQQIFIPPGVYILKKPNWAVRLYRWVKSLFKSNIKIVGYKTDDS